jgi:hypothetical protein
MLSAKMLTNKRIITIVGHLKGKVTDTLGKGQFVLLLKAELPRF